MRLGVNVDHVATVRNARGGALPDPVRAALMAVESGASGITAHLREDRRHIRDDDVRRLKAELTVPLNLEMAATDEMVAIALATRPHACCLVPEKRSERTTEGGLDVIGGHDHLRDSTAELAKVGIRVSLFVEPSIEAIRAARSIGAPVVELHTGVWCDLLAHGDAERAAREFERLRLAAAETEALGIECHAGHGLDYATARAIGALPQLKELNIGHFLIGEAMFFGFAAVIAEMLRAIEQGRGHASRGDASP